MNLFAILLHAITSIRLCMVWLVQYFCADRNAGNPVETGSERDTTNSFGDYNRFVVQKVSKLQRKHTRRHSCDASIQRRNRSVPERDSPVAQERKEPKEETVVQEDEEQRESKEETVVQEDEEQKEPKEKTVVQPSIETSVTPAKVETPNEGRRKLNPFVLDKTQFQLLQHVREERQSNIKEPKTDPIFTRVTMDQQDIQKTTGDGVQSMNHTKSKVYEQAKKLSSKLLFRKHKKEKPCT